MEISVKDLSKRENSTLFELIKGFVPYSQKRLKYKEPFIIKLVSDAENAADPMGKTAFYSPEDLSITLFVDNRHDKDIMRSLSHEIIHHSQNCEGRFPENSVTEVGYAQKDMDLRRLEAEAYLLGNGLMFRDYEDSLKEQKRMDKEKLKFVLREAIKRAGKTRKKEDKQAVVESVQEDESEIRESIVEYDTAFRRESKHRNEQLFEILTERWFGDNGSENG